MNVGIVVSCVWINGRIDRAREVRVELDEVDPALTYHHIAGSSSMESSVRSPKSGNKVSGRLGWGRRPGRTPNQSVSRAASSKLSEGERGTGRSEAI